MNYQEWKREETKQQRIAKCLHIWKSNNITPFDTETCTLCNRARIKRSGHGDKPPKISGHINKCFHVWADSAKGVDIEECAECGTFKKKKGQPSNNYYKEGGIEVIDFIKAKLTQEQYKGFLLGTIIKYSGRANFKDSFPKDIEKLTTYANYLKKEVEGNGEKT